MKIYIESLLTREKERFEKVAERQRVVNKHLEEFNQENRGLILEASHIKEKVDFLNRMLIEEEETE